MKQKQYNIEPTEEPMIASEPAFAYGNASYSDMVAKLYRSDSVLEQDNAAEPDRKAEFEEDEDLDNGNNAAEWDEIEREGVMVGIEQILRGKCYTHEEVFGEIYRMLDEYKETHRWS